MKTSENLWFSDVFRGYQKRSVALNGLNIFALMKTALSFCDPRLVFIISEIAADLCLLSFFFRGGRGEIHMNLEQSFVFVEQLFVDTIIENHSVQPPPPPSFIFKMKGLGRIFIYRYTLLCTRRGHFCSLGEEFPTKAFDYHKAIPLFMKFE